MFPSLNIPLNIPDIINIEVDTFKSLVIVVVVFAAAVVVVVVADVGGGGRGIVFRCPSADPVYRVWMFALILTMLGSALLSFLPLGFCR